MVIPTSMHQIQWVVILVLIGVGYIGEQQQCQAFQHLPTTQPVNYFNLSVKRSLSFALSLAGKDDNENGDNHQKPDDDNGDDFLPSKVDNFLDEPFFDPDAYDETDDSFLGKLANFVKSDYELAETLYVGTIFVVLLIVTQELLRMQLHGDNYLPFAGGSRGGRLF